MAADGKLLNKNNNKKSKRYLLLILLADVSASVGSSVCNQINFTVFGRFSAPASVKGGCAVAHQKYKIWTDELKSVIHSLRLKGAQRTIAI